MGNGNKLNCVQRVIGRSIQPLPRKNPSATVPLGWLTLERYIKLKKLLFMWALLALSVDTIYKKSLIRHFEQWKVSRRALTNQFGSPVYDLIATCKKYRLFERFERAIISGLTPDRNEWVRIARCKKDEEEKVELNQNLMMYRRLQDLSLIVDPGKMVHWWMMSLNHVLIRQYEIMVLLVCDESQLKGLESGMRVYFDV